MEGEVANQTQFEYAWCLVRSDYSSDIKKVKSVLCFPQFRLLRCVYALV